MFRWDNATWNLKKGATDLGYDSVVEFLDGLSLPLGQLEVAVGHQLAIALALVELLDEGRQERQALLLEAGVPNVLEVGERDLRIVRRQALAPKAQ